MYVCMYVCMYICMYNFFAAQKPTYHGVTISKTVFFGLFFLSNIDLSLSFCLIAYL